METHLYKKWQKLEKEIRKLGKLVRYNESVLTKEQLDEWAEQLHQYELEFSCVKRETTRKLLERELV